MDYSILLDREPVKIDLKKTLNYVRGKKVIITGAGGSIGSEIAKQMLYGDAKRLYLLGHGENSIFRIDRKLCSLQSIGVGTKTDAIIPIIGEIQDRDYIFHLLQNLDADILFHTAAHKHVSLGEKNPVEVIRNNVFGTKNLIDASKKYLNEKFIIISSDKCVEPTSIYGASKLLAEELILREVENHKFLIVRFGNVIGSNGSVVPIFEEEILEKEEIHLAHAGAKRFFMTIEEAVSLILKVGQIGKGGEVYILDMGEQVRIKDLAIKIAKHHHKLIRRFIMTNLKKGEKLEEKLWADNEEITKTEHEGILRLKKKNIIKDLDNILLDLRNVCFKSKIFPELYRERTVLREMLRDFIPTIPIYKEQQY